jgi:citronellol/citronellal dehydrogenase
MKLKDKVAIVTGSSRGIGKAIAIDFAKEGAAVVIAARTETEQEKLPGTIYTTADEIRAFGGMTLPVRCDVADEQSVEEMVKKTLDEFGKINILVNNAAIGYYRSFMETPIRHLDLAFRVNLRGPFLCIKSILPEMIKQKSGSIINISSSAADEIYSRIKRPEEPRRRTGIIYGATKAALDRLTCGLAAEVVEYNIAVNALKPSAPTYSEGLAMWNPDAVGLFRSPHEFMTKAAIFLATQDSKGLTGGVFFDEELGKQYLLT